MLVFLGIFITRIVVPAYLMLGYWFLLQLLGGGLASGSRRAVWRSGPTPADSSLEPCSSICSATPSWWRKHRALARTVERGWGIGSDRRQAAGLLDPSPSPGRSR